MRGCDRGTEKGGSVKRQGLERGGEILQNEFRKGKSEFKGAFTPASFSSVELH